MEKTTSTQKCYDFIQSVGYSQVFVLLLAAYSTFNNKTLLCSTHQRKVNMQSKMSKKKSTFDLKTQISSLALFAVQTHVLSGKSGSSFFIILPFNWSQVQFTKWLIKLRIQKKLPCLAVYHFSVRDIILKFLQKVSPIRRLNKPCGSI